MNNIEIRNKGFITLSDKVMISDPCYGMGTWCQGVVDNVLKGNYKCTVEVSDEGDWGKRISAIQVVHEDYVDKFLEYYKEKFKVGVDSGQAGIFDYEYYAKYHSDEKETEHADRDWYWRAYECTYKQIKNPNYEKFDWEKYKDDILEACKAHDEYMMSDKANMYIKYTDGNTIDGLGFVSSSGYGDGVYDCWVSEYGGKVVAIRVEYITEDEEDM